MYIRIRILEIKSIWRTLHFRPLHFDAPFKSFMEIRIDSRDFEEEDSAVNSEFNTAF